MYSQKLFIQKYLSEKKINFKFNYVYIYTKTDIIYLIQIHFIYKFS